MQKILSVHTKTSLRDCQYYCNAEVIQPNPEFPVVGSLVFIDKEGEGNYERGRGPF